MNAIARITMHSSFRDHVKPASTRLYSGYTSRAENRVQALSTYEPHSHRTSHAIFDRLRTYNLCIWCKIQAEGDSHSGLDSIVSATLIQSFIASDINRFKQELSSFWDGRGLPPLQVASWSIQPFGFNTATSQTGHTDRTDNGPIA